MVEALKSAAREYWLEGHNIILLKGKEPLHKWSQWQTERQNEIDFEALPWSQADGFAIICGQQIHNGTYVAAIDFDVKNLPEKVVEKGRQALKFLPVTQMEQTPSGGLHYIYFSRVKPRSISAYHNECGLELLGEGKLCIMAPSQGYKRLNDNSPTEVENIEALFYEALEKAGVKIEKPSQAWFDQPELNGKPYRGKDPPCIQALLKGAREGLRNEYGIRLASYFINFKGYQPKTVREILKSWNKLNIPELPWREVDNIIKSAVQGRYVYGCSDPILKSKCEREKCPLAPKQIAKLLTPEERERAERLIEDPKLLDYVVQFGRHRLIGEDNTLLINFVVLCSGQTKYPISCILSGFSGSGKNESIKAIKPLIPPEWLFEFTTSTPEAVKYIPEEFAGTLVIYEIAGMESKTGTLGLRSVGEGESIETIFPVRDEETGKMMLGRHKTNARNFITTESELDIHADLYRRVLKVSLNHSDVLTRRVLAKKLRDAMLPEGLRKKLGLDVGSKLPYSEKDFQNALRLVDWNVEVVIFPPASLLKFEQLAVKKEQKVALRSQIERILNFIRVLAIIHQRQRTIIEGKEDGSKFVVAGVEDFERAMKILAPSIVETVSRLEKRQNEALELIENSTAEEFWDKNKLAQKLGVSTVTAAKILKTLANLGYLREIQATRPYSYELIQDREKPKQLVLLEEINEYKAFYEKELKTFLTRILSRCQNLQVRGVSLDLQAQVKEPGKIPLLGGERQGDKMPVTPNLSLFEQNKPGMLFDSERTSENEISKPTIKIEDSAIPALSHGDEEVISDKTGKGKMSNDKRKPENQISTLIGSDLGFFKLEVDEKQKLHESWISKVEGNRVYFRTGEVLFACLYCKDKTIYFANEADLQRHIRALHTGYPDNHAR